MEAEQLNVIVVEDHLAMREGIKLLLHSAGFRIAGLAGRVDEARLLLERRSYDVALIDVHLGEDSSLGLVEELLRRDPNAPVVLYTGYTGPDSDLSDAVRTGARGFVLKSSPAERLIDALHAIAGGGLYVDPDLAGLLSMDAQLSRLTMLTAREHEILGLLAEGMTGQAIAKRLFLSPETVRTHVRNATTRLGARTRVQAVAMLVRSRRLGEQRALRAHAV